MSLIPPGAATQLHLEQQVLPVAIAEEQEGKQKYLCLGFGLSLSSGHQGKQASWWRLTLRAGNAFWHVEAMAREGEDWEAII